MIAFPGSRKTQYLNVFSLLRPAWAALVLSVVLPGPLPATAEGVAGADLVPSGEAQRLGERIRMNETGGRADRLLWWNAGEDFASVGIGHFIWYPPGREPTFQESFPALVAWLREAGAPLPAWLDAEPAPACPWPDQARFEAARREDPRFAELQRLLEETVPEQARFLVRRLETARPRLLAAVAPEARPALTRRLDRLLATPAGRYALVDYVNFKGEGLAPGERYRGQGWGLLQVLTHMDDRGPAVDAFAEAAAAVLRRRVDNAPPGRREARWLPGWLQRVSGYPHAP